MYHYVYRITNIKLFKHYYGKRSSKLPPKEDIGIKYFSSSKDKQFMQDQISNPDNYIYVVIEEFESAIDAINAEILLHDIADVAINSRFYNKSKQTSSGWDTTGIAHTEEYKARMSKILKGRVVSEETKAKMSKAQIGNKKGLGKKLSEEHKAKLIESNKTRVWTSEAREAARVRSSGFNNVRAVPLNIYEYGTNKLIAENVLANLWCKDKKLHAANLRATAYSDKTKPHCSNRRNKEKYNPHHYKGLYAVKAK